MPKLGETVTEGTVGRWLKQVGETVAFDDPLFEVSTDKVDSEIPSPYDGVLLEILVRRGRDRAGRHPAGPHRRRRAPGRGGTGRRRCAARLPAAPPAAATAAAAVRRRPATGRPAAVPVVRRLVAEHGLDVAAIPGTGAGGRIMREDVVEAVAAGQARPAAAAALPPPRRPRAAPPRPPPRGRGAAAPPAATATRSCRCPGCASLSPSGWWSRRRSRRRVDLDRGGPRTSSRSGRSTRRFQKETGASLTYLPFIARASVDALRASRW